MRQKSFWIIVVIILLGIVLPLGLWAQSDNVPPPLPFSRPVLSESEEEKMLYPDGKRPTNTPTKEEEKNLPTVEPPVIPTAEAIDIAPDYEGVRYEIVIRRGKDGHEVLLRVPINIKAEDVIDKYLKRDEGDEYYVAPPAHSEPPQIEINPEDIVD